MVPPDNALRVLHDPPLDGPTNMARDEALLQVVGDHRSPPTLRLYEWTPPTISLGYFQPFAEFEAMGPSISTLAVVRRPTGGGAILHDLELTYSLALPLNHVLLSRGPNSLYELAHDAVIESLKSLGADTWRGAPTDGSGPTRGPFFCFARRHRFDVLLGHDKVAGSAQRRTRTAVLQHGSIILGNRFHEQPTTALDCPTAGAISQLRDQFALTCPRMFGMVGRPGEWSQEELDLARTLLPKQIEEGWLRRI